MSTSEVVSPASFMCQSPYPKYSKSLTPEISFSRFIILAATMSDDQLLASITIDLLIEENDQDP